MDGDKKADSAATTPARNSEIGKENGSEGAPRRVTCRSIAESLCHASVISGRATYTESVTETCAKTEQIRGRGLTGLSTC